MSKDWKKERDELAERLTERAQMLVGATIKSAKVVPHDDDCDGVNRLIIITDKGKFTVTGSYGGYDGNSCDEYPEYISLEAELKELEEK